MESAANGATLELKAEFLRLATELLELADTIDAQLANADSEPNWLRTTYQA